MKVRAIFFLVVFGFTACTSPQPVDIQGTAVALAKTGVALTQTVQPTATLPPTVTPTATVAYPMPSPYPTQKPLPIFTPDAIQVERWKEYQRELAKIVLSGYGSVSKYALCEWDILGRATQEVYVWAQCSEPRGGYAERPAMIYLEAYGSIKNVRVAGFKGAFFDLSFFPTDIQEKIPLYYSPGYPYQGRPEVLRLHLLYREAHPEEPPLIILSATPTP